MVKVCAHQYCNHEFEAEHYKAKYCSADHYAVCENCGKKFSVSKPKLSKPHRACSASCASSLGHTDASQQKRKENSLKKHGTEFPAQSDTVKEKIKKTLDDNPDKDFRIGSQNYHKLLKNRFGVDNVSSLDVVKEKKKSSSLSKFGTDNPFQNKEVQEKFKKTMIEKYGDRHSTQLLIQNFDEYKDLEEWVIEFKKMNNIKPTITDASQYFNVNSCTISVHKNALNLHKYFRSFSSHKEERFIDFLEFELPDVHYRRNDRTLISPMEVDFYFPDYHFAVEISPTSTHHSSETLLNYGKNNPKEKNYHRNKFLSAEEKGIELFTVFDWMPWRKSLEMIKHKLHGSSSRIYARKTVGHFFEKSSDKKKSRELKNFIDVSHVMGFDGRGVSYYSYLTFEDNIVGVAAFGKPRQLNVHKAKRLKNTDSSPDKDSNSDDDIELIRLCFAPGFSVVGGASKLLKIFINGYRDSGFSVNSLTTFSDNDFGSGTIYESLGFENVFVSPAQKNFVHEDMLVGEVDDCVYFTIKNSSLYLLGADRLLNNFPGYQHIGVGDDLPSNEEIVLSYGFIPVFDCGYKKWIMKL